MTRNAVIPATPLARPTDLLKHYEQQAQDLRAQAGVGSSDPINPFDFARRLNADVLFPEQIPGMTKELLDGILGMDAKDWSGGAHFLPDGRLQIVVNSSQSKERRNVTILEELAHRHYGHQPSIIGSEGRSPYHREQEEEVGLPLFCGLGQSQAARLFSNSAGLRKFRLECNRCLL
jgi:hypothetical protein